MDKKLYAIRYRGCYKGELESPDPDDTNVGKIYYWTMEKILEEINSDRSGGWTDYDETDWKEGLDEWTWYEPVEESDCDGDTAKGLWIVSVATYLKDTCESMETENLGVYAKAYTSYDEARDGLRNDFIREAVNEEYEGSDDADEKVEPTIDEIVEDGDEKSNVWTWETSNKAFLWRVFPQG